MNTFTLIVLGLFFLSLLVLGLFFLSLLVIAWERDA